MRYRVRPALYDYEVRSYVHDGDVIPEDALDCSLGINPFGCTPLLTRELLADTFDGLQPYPSFPYPALREAICEYWSPVAKIKPEQLAIHTGSMGMLLDLNRLFIGPGTHVLVAEPTFSSATTDMRAMEGILDAVPLREENKFELKVDDFIAALKPEHAFVYLDNPNNPTGQVTPLEDIARLAEAALAQETTVIVDEAYGDFMDLENSAVTLLAKYPNLIAVRTLSKGFGLAGIRTGYAVVAEEFVPIMRKLPAEMAITEMAARLAPVALRDREHIASSRKKIAKNKEEMLDSLTVLQVSKTNLTVPISLLYTDQDINLYSVFLRHGIITERGEDFDGIGKRHVRLRVPQDIHDLLPRLAAVEAELRGDL